MGIQNKENTPRDVVALATPYADGAFLETHVHERAQFLYAIRGMMEVDTSDGKWLVLPYSGVWIPSLKPHSVRMLNVSTHSLYIKASVSLRHQHCEVLSVTPLMHALLLEAPNIPLLYEIGGRDDMLMQLLLHEVKLATPVSIHIPLPQDPKLLEQCQNFIRQPSIHVNAEDWALAHHKSLRTFSRFFVGQLGMTFGQWRQRVCLLSALLAMEKGNSITQIAFDLGYESSSAFSAMFKKNMQHSPRTLFKLWRNGGVNL